MKLVPTKTPSQIKKWATPFFQPFDEPFNEQFEDYQPIIYPTTFVDYIIDSSYKDLGGFYFRVDVNDPEEAEEKLTTIANSP